MKKRLIIALALMVSGFSFAQKDEIKTAERAIKDNNFAEAKSALNAAQALVGSTDEKTQAKYYFLKGQALYANGAGSNADIDAAIESFNKVKKIEADSGKEKYTPEVEEIKVQMLSNFLTKGQAALEQKQYIKSSDHFEKAYRMSPKDTIYLYYAASTAVSAQDYDKSLGLYEELKDLGFTGEEMEYTAVNKATNEEEGFANKSMRDIAMKSGDYIKPEDKKSESKASEIMKNIALIYVSKGDNEKAISAIKDAREESPDDLNLLITEANVQLKLGNRDAFKVLMEEATTKDPDNAELQYNLGVIAAEGGDNEAAKKYYARAIELNPEYADAQNNMAVLILAKDEEIIEKMNALGNSTADNKKYDEYKEARLDIYKEAIPYLEKAFNIKPNVSTAKTLMNIYSAIGDTVKFKEMKAKVEALESGN
ncbi:tetratricopeptide repeat protein [Flavobacteriaceae bacterium MAR_2010_72]|nr:tetratricopeptide repeat protein [Flavobacteriaceae bacterium MAR_2010_72]TVZ59795.1 tetratricopeptide repeat protein [Flavobacteriaceae bacterium MAR_2010_105]